MAMINNSIHTTAARSSSCGRGALNYQGRQSGVQSRDKEDDFDVFTRKYYYRHVSYIKDCKHACIVPLVIKYVQSQRDVIM